MESEKKKMPKWAIAIIIIVIICAIAGIAGGGNSELSDNNSKENNNNQEIQTSETIKEEDNIPTEYKNALNQADTYANVMHMSKQGIYDQLISEYGGQFEADAAQYAIDNVQADWNANALATAKSYQETMSMSKSAIYDQLISEYGEQFTPEEAQYAIDNLD